MTLATPHAVTLSNITFHWPDGAPVVTGLSLTVPTGFSSLIGANGSGKTTLLKIIAGQLVPQIGSVSGGGIVGLATQDPQRDVHATVADGLHIAGVLAALSRIERGSTSVADFDTVGDRWDVIDRATAQLEALGLPTDPATPMRLLSGGEAALVEIAGQLLLRPDTLLLDEPTNSLDRVGRTRLLEVIDRFPGVVVAVSHDLELLERAHTTVELYRGEARTFGGPYSLYRTIIDDEQRVAEQAVTTAENALRKQSRELTAARTTIDRRRAYAKKSEANNVVPKIVAHSLRSQAQESGAKLRIRHERDVAAARRAGETAQEALREDRELRLLLPNNGIATNKVAVRAEALTIVGAERVALVGPNGSGKTTLIRRLLASGSVTVPCAYLPQNLEFPDESLVSVLAAADPESGTQQVHAQLARFLFRGVSGERMASTLSGGERVRLALAAATFRRPSPELLILDEPTNNLDIVSVEILADAIRSWSGALLLVSHDAVFVEHVGVTRTLALPST